MYGWRMLIGLCPATSTIHVNLRRTLAISINLYLRTSHFLTQSTPKAPNSGHKELLRRARRRRLRRFLHPLHFAPAFLDKAFKKNYTYKTGGGLERPRRGGCEKAPCRGVHTPPQHVILLPGFSPLAIASICS
ncbi:MAG: hypothetical protein ACO2PM_25550, partial [Pyrobaculum sp.]